MTSYGSSRPREIWALLKEGCASPWPHGAGRHLGYRAKPLNWTLFLPVACSQGWLLSTICLRSHQALIRITAQSEWCPAPA